MPTATNSVLHKHIISLLNLEALPAGQQAMFLDKMTEVINGRLILRLLDTLDAGSRKEFELAMDDSGESALENFLVKKVPGFVDMIGEETLKLKSEMLTHLQTV